MSSIQVFFLSFGIVLFGLGLVERFVHVILEVAVFQSEKGDLRSGLLVGSFLKLTSMFVTTALSLFVRCVRLVGWLLVWYLFFYLITAVWFSLYEDYPMIVIKILNFYNLRVGPFLHGYIFLPLDLLNLILKAVLPLYNSFVWIMKGLLLKGILPIVWKETETLTHFFLSIIGLCESFAKSLVSLFLNLPCDNMSCLKQPIVFDSISVLGNFRDAAVVASKLTSQLCPALSVPTDLILYIFIDVHFTKAVHNFANAILHMLIRVPQVTQNRCSNLNSTSAHLHVLMCTPDVQPIFEYFITGTREVGFLIDNWLSVGAAMARRSLLGLPNECSNDPLAPNQYSSQLLEGAYTTVGLTESLMAETNGTHAYFWGRASYDVGLRLWPAEIDVSLGVSAVSYSSSADFEASDALHGPKTAARQTTSLMGCKCLDGNGSFSVRCSILPFSQMVSAEDYSFEVAFQDYTWVQSLTCAAVEIHVKSVRWPVRRYEGRSVPYSSGYLNLDLSDCASRGTCESIDSTIWMIPKCDLLPPALCSDAAVGTSCFPFCMAMRVTGSGNSRPVFVNAETWRNGKQLLMRNCAQNYQSATAGSRFQGSNDKVIVYANTGGVKEQILFVESAGDDNDCLTSSSHVTSWVPQNQSGLDDRSVHPYIRRKGQPFAVTGDAILMEFLHTDGSSTVEVDRLSGNQKDVYTLKPGWAGLPTAPKMLVPSEELSLNEKNRIVVPMNLVHSRIPSVSSRNYLFYAVSPDLRIFEAYMEYCRDKSTLPKIQLMVLSSYSALRVYRVRAYCQENCEHTELTAQYTFDGFSDGNFNQNTFPQDCSRVYNASIRSMEYVNEQNIAVTVQVADKSYDPARGYGANSSFVTYWLNPQTMLVRKGDMWSHEMTSANMASELCIVGDTVPQVGSFAAELGVALIHVLHKVVGGFLYTPGMLAFWRGNSVCPLDAAGHSVLSVCGSNVYDLDDLFDSFDAAGSIFWGIPAWFSEQLQQGQERKYTALTNILQGFSAYGSNAVGISGIQNGVISLFNTPIPQEMSRAFAIVKEPGSISMFSKMSNSGLSFARFSAKYLCTVGAIVMERVVQSKLPDISSFWTLLVNQLYDQKLVYKTVVTERGISACNGLRMMFGNNNPVSDLIFHSCCASVQFFQGTLDMFLNIFVNGPVIKCVCKDSAGHVQGNYARQKCVLRAPELMKPVLYGMISRAEEVLGDDSYLCSSIISTSREELDKSYRPFFSELFLLFEALGSSVDYMMSGTDIASGDCQGLHVDPQVVVIMPEPVDYFRSCSHTAYCKAKCAGEWEALSNEMSRHDQRNLSSSKIISIDIKSLFFPSVVEEIIAPGSIVAMVQGRHCSAFFCRSIEDDCLAVSFLSRNKDNLHVNFYCSPQLPSLSVYKSENTSSHWMSAVPNAPIKVQFLDSEGSAAVAMFDRHILLMGRGIQTKAVLDTRYIYSLPLRGMYPMSLVDMFSVRSFLLVSVAVKVGNNAKFERDISVLWIKPFDINDIYASPVAPDNLETVSSNLETEWNTLSNDVFPMIVDIPEMKYDLRNYAASEYPTTTSDSSTSFFLWPVAPTASTMRMLISWTDQAVVATFIPVDRSSTLISRATLLPRNILLSKVLREDSSTKELRIYATSGNNYDWLRQLRISLTESVLTSATISNSQSLPGTLGISTACDGLDCRGCPDLKMRSMCSNFQSCAVFRCIGTPINLKKPLCGIGGILKSMGNLAVTNIQGAWVMFVDVFMITLKVYSVNNLPGVEISFPEDSFLSNICAAKDLSANIFSVLTAAINSLLQRVQSVSGVFGSMATLDSSANSIISMSIASLTGLLHQIALAPIYVLGVGHKIMMCQVSGFLAVTTQSGFRIDISPAKFAGTDAMGGQCLATGAETSMAETGEPSSMSRLSSNSAFLAGSIGSRAVLQRLEPFVHLLDGLLAYIIGILKKLAEFIQNMDLRNCVLPDVALQSTVRCSCNDQPLSISRSRSTENYEKNALWCSGVLSFVDSNNKQKMVWNPFSYAQLQDVIGGSLDRFVREASQTNSASAFNHPIFQQQGVSIMSVLTKCRQNYVNKQWDAYAYVLFDREKFTKYFGKWFSFPDMPVGNGVGRCLLDSANGGMENFACLDSYLQSTNNNNEYWSYDMSDNTVSSQLLDACLVFSGPSSNQLVSAERREPFRRCLNGFESSEKCELNGYVWSPSSNNDVPVAAQHVIKPGPTNSQGASYLQSVMNGRMEEARVKVMAILTSLQNYDNAALKTMFFSAEGDIIHQLMDCVFMGPYSKVKYWPTPECGSNSDDDCLIGPYWSRDIQNGRSRKLDVETCNVSQSIPFTCGSPTRKAMIRHFFENYLDNGREGNKIIIDSVQQWIADLKNNWEDSSKYFCSNSSNCTDYLPVHLSNFSMKISADNIINQLGERLEVFYKSAILTSEPWINNLHPDEKSKYFWSSSKNSYQVNAYGLFDPVEATTQYDEANALKPPTDILSPSIWRTCHSALKQVMFTLPVNLNGELHETTINYSGGGPDVIESSIKQIMARAKERSPLYRTHVLKHHPSYSRVCNGSVSSDPRIQKGSVTFDDYYVNNQKIFDSSEFSPIPVLSFDSGSLGDAWRGQKSGINEHLGFLDRASTDLWAQGRTNLKSSSEFVLRYGVAGLKVGNIPSQNKTQHNVGMDIGDLNDAFLQNFNETDREYALDSAQLHGCSAYKANVSDYLKLFFDELFPAAQGIRESGVGAYCMRYAIELALLHALDIWELKDQAEWIAQKTNVIQWKRKCGTQVQLIAMCNALNIYRPNPLENNECLMQWAVNKNGNSEIYTTPECLVKIGENFYDPCQCMPQLCLQNSSYRTIEISEIQRNECRLHPDPRNFVAAAELGWWDDTGDTSDLARKLNDWNSDSFNFLDFSSFVNQVFFTDSNASNSSVLRDWLTLEGFMNETGLDCDMVVDYWPEDMQFPVGYHVTSQCHADDASYRSFDNAFALDRDSDGNPILILMEDQTRDAQFIHTHFGAGGVCRQMNFGMNMYETNTMRVCTSQNTDDFIDMHVPRGSFPLYNMSSPQCSSSGMDLPWADYSFYDYYNPVFYSVGTVPSLPSPEGSIYPESTDLYMELGPQQKILLEGWGDDCEDFFIPDCRMDDRECPSGYVCTQSGVCQNSMVECTSHADCSDQLVCTAMGHCVRPKVSILSDVDYNISVKAHTSSCAGESFSMKGASHWGYVPDLLEAHGMCSYRHWQEYLYTLEKCECQALQDNTVCNLKAGSCSVYRFSSVENTNKWWNDTSNSPVRLRMIPTTCDRNYDRFTLDNLEMVSCVPVFSDAWMIDPAGNYRQQAERDFVWKIYDPSVKTVALKRMPYFNQTGTGFLGVDNIDNIKSCLSVQQCYVHGFTRNGRLSMKRSSSGIYVANRTLVNGGEYNSDDQFRCGIMGIYNPVTQKCNLDLKIIPLYRLLCKNTNVTVNLMNKCRGSMDVTALSTSCENILEEYSPDYSVINDVNVPALNNLLYVFMQPTNLEQHVNLVECVNTMYSEIKTFSMRDTYDSRSLYLLFPFSVYEFPFSWFYQCIIGNAIRIDINANQNKYTCTKYEQNKELSSASLNGMFPNFRNDIFSFRGGYAKLALDQAIKNQVDILKQAWFQSVNETVNDFFVGSIDKTYPRCYPQLEWNLPNNDLNLLGIIESFNSRTCTTRTLNKFLSRFNALRSTTYNTESIVPIITVPKGEMIIQFNSLVSNALITGILKRFGESQISEKNLYRNVNTSTLPLRINYDIVDENSTYFNSMINTWQSLTGILPLERDVFQLYQSDNCKTFVDLYRDSNNNIIPGGQDDVKVCSIYAVGFFQCSYPSLKMEESDSTIAVNASLPDLEDQFQLYLKTIYRRVKKRYDIKVENYQKSGILSPVLPSNLEFFLDENTSAFGRNWKFDLTDNIKYRSNINPDIRTPVMCVAGNQRVNFQACSNQNFESLKQHVTSNYKHNGSLIVPVHNQLDWNVNKRMLSSGAIFSFTDVNRDTSKMYMARMFDDYSVCGPASTTTNREKMCYIQTTGSLGTTNIIAPWLAGDWNPYDQCDVKKMDLQNGNAEIVDSLCYFQEYCPAEQGLDPNMKFYKNMPNKQCKDRDGERTTHMNVNENFLYNLCTHRLNEDSVCQNRQGVLGGTDGLPSESYNVGGDLFTLHEMYQDQNFNSLFANPLFTGENIQNGVLRLNSSHIGMHHIGMIVSNTSTTSTMKVYKTPMKIMAPVSHMKDWDTQETEKWIENWEDSLILDQREFEKQYHDIESFSTKDSSGRLVLGWDCPLKRRVYYGSNLSGFMPLLPSARRSRKIFGRLTDEKYAHPIQKRSVNNQIWGKYKTTNGFCFCPSNKASYDGMCSVPTDVTTEHNCSLYNTVKTLQGKQWGWSHTYTARNLNNEYQKCTLQVDWPYVPGQLRDGSSLSNHEITQPPNSWYSDAEEQSCHVLDRMPDFSYIYLSEKKLKNTAYNTVKNGVCHTGRVQGVHKTDNRCILLFRGDASAILQCMDKRNVTVIRNRSQSVADALARARLYRRPCRTCTKKPDFYTRSGAKIQAESSFGELYRASTEKMLAKSLKDLLCNGQDNCTALLNKTSWKKGTFMSALLNVPQSLFINPQNTTGAFKDMVKQNEKISDSDPWAEPWVYCPNPESLRTNSHCRGSISKEQWRNNKVKMCHSTIVQSIDSNQDVTASTEICNIDSRLGELCSVIKEAQSMIAGVNCMASSDPKCALREYVYNPSSWDVTNQAFVHQTVNEYYYRVDNCASWSQCICTLDQTSQAQVEANQRVLRQCNAQPIFMFRSVVIEMRSLVLEITKILSMIISIGFNLLLTFSPQTEDIASSNLILEWVALKQESNMMFEKLSDIFFDLIFSVGRLGPYLKINFAAACNTVNSAYVYVANIWCDMIVQQLPLFLGALRSVAGWTEVGFSVVNDVFKTILNGMLPDAVINLYQAGYREYFQSARYQQKQAAYEERKQVGLVNMENNKVKKSKGDYVPPENRWLQALGDSREKRINNLKKYSGYNTVNEFLGTIKGMGALGKGATALDLGLTIWDIYNTIKTAQQVREALESFPTSFTLFDYDDFYLSIDAFAEFLNSDFTCYNMNANITPLQCTALNFTEPSLEDVRNANYGASLCWAEAQQREVGVSNLYSCTGSSICCQDPLHCESSSSQLPTCSECPVAMTGLLTYGCNTMIQRCQCGVENHQVDRCMAQRECGISKSCSLLTSSIDVSFGTLQSCNQCPVSPICFLGSNQQYGQCSCLTSPDEKVDICAGPIGARINPSASRLCGMARERSGYYLWEELSLTACLNLADPICSEVMTENGIRILMSVGIQLGSVQNSFNSRRLLSIQNINTSKIVGIPSALLPENPADDLTPDLIHAMVTEFSWNHTAMPCSSLADLYRRGINLGPVDESTLHSCVYWRVVARQLIQEHRLEYLKDSDTFLLSPDDLANVLGKKGVLLELMSKPMWLFHALLYTSYMKPIRAALISSHSPDYIDYFKSIRNHWEGRFFKKRKGTRDMMNDIEKDIEDELLHSDAQFNVSDGRQTKISSRRLMTVYDDTDKRIRTLPYYNLVRKIFSNFTLFRDVKLMDSFYWQSDSPSFHRLSIKSYCPVADSMWLFAKTTLLSGEKYYNYFMTGKHDVQTNLKFKNILPKFGKYNVSWQLSNNSKTLDWVLNIFGTSVTDLSLFLSEPCPKQNCLNANSWTAQYLLESLTFCELDSVMFCAGRKNDLVMSTLFMFFIYVILGMMLSYLGFSGIVFWLWSTFFLSVLWFSTGVSPRCAPMIPTCLLDDVINAMKNLFPSSAYMPQKLIGALAMPNTLISCNTLNMSAWEDPLTFAICDLGFCDDWENKDVWGLSKWRFKDMQFHVTGPDVNAYRVCASVYSVYTIPYLGVVLFGGYCISILGLSFLSMVSPLIELIWQIVLYNHQKK